MADLDAPRELCSGELFTFPAAPPWLGWGQQADVLRRGSQILSPHNCQHPHSLYFLREKNQEWKGEGRPGNKGWGQCFNFAFFLTS